MLRRRNVIREHVCSPTVASQIQTHFWQFLFSLPLFPASDMSEELMTDDVTWHQVTVPPWHDASHSGFLFNLQVKPIGRFFFSCCLTFKFKTRILYKKFWDQTKMCVKTHFPHVWVTWTESGSSLWLQLQPFGIKASIAHQSIDHLLLEKETLLTRRQTSDACSSYHTWLSTQNLQHTVISWRSW